MATSAQDNAAAGSPVISARGLTKRFADQRAVNGIAFDIYPGRSNCPSGMEDVLLRLTGV
jgi:ABC-type sugar transport system ATPase subunit